MPGGAIRVAVVANYAYLASRDKGLRIIDVSDPVAPVEAGSYKPPDDAYDIVVEGTYAFVAAWLAGLRVVDVSNPASPVEMGSYSIPGAAFRDVALERGYIYLTAGGSGVYVLDISIPKAPIEIGFSRTDYPRNAGHIAVIEGYAYVTYADLDRWGGLLVLNISDPQSVSASILYDIYGGAGSVVAGAGYVLVSAGEGGLYIFQAK